MRRATQERQTQMLVAQRVYERTHRRDQRPSHPQSNISGGASRQAGNRFANFPLRIQRLSSLRKMFSELPPWKKKLKPPLQIVVFATIQFWCLPSQFTMSAEEWNNPSFRPASVGWLGVTRHLAVAAHWLLLLGDCRLSVSIATPHN